MRLDFLKLYGEVNWSKLERQLLKRSEIAKRKAYNPFFDVLNSAPNHLPLNIQLDIDTPIIGEKGEINDEQFKNMEELALNLSPWRKGPFSLFGLDIDSEWRSNLKWNRIADNMSNLFGKKVLDIGCNNGYYMFRMSAQNPEFVLGIDPSVLSHVQFHFLNKYAQKKNLYHELLGMEEVHCFKDFFDTIFHMGVLYHHKSPIKQLQDCYDALAPGGEIILETMGIPGEGDFALFPEKRYSKMRNVYFFPTKSTLNNWLKKVKFIDIEIISESKTSSREQRLSKFCPPQKHQSLSDFLDPNDDNLTVEGYPAPYRFVAIARKKL